MTRINTNVPAIFAQTRLARSHDELQSSLQRLSSGLRINRGADDPAGLIASESLRGEISGLGQAISNAERASNVIATAEGSLNEVAAMLITIQELVIEAANAGAVSDDEINANQLQVDSAVESISRIANTASFAGLKLLDGSLSYITSGVAGSAITSLDLFSVQFGMNSAVSINVEVMSVAEKGNLRFPATSIPSAISVQIRGPEGGTTLSFGAGTKCSAIAHAINTIADATGVEAYYSSPLTTGSGLMMQSVGYGSKEFVTVDLLPGSGSFGLKNAAGATAVRDAGKDVLANVNGIISIGDGLTITLQSVALDMEAQLDETVPKNGTTSFTVTGGGALFQLGPRVNTNLQANIGIRSLNAARLGTSTVGYLSQIATGENYSLVAGKAREANRIVAEAINQVSVLRGRLGAFERNALDTNIAALQISLENVTASESSIRDADFAVEMSQLTRNQILVQAGTAVLTMANTTPQSVLSLLGG